MASNPERERELRAVLLTVDGKGRAAKEAALNELLALRGPSEQEAQPDLSGFSDADLHNELLEREQRRYAEGTVLAAAREAQPQATRPDAELRAVQEENARFRWALREIAHTTTLGGYTSDHCRELAYRALSESQPASPAADTELADMRELYEQAKNDPRREILTDFAAWLTTQPGTLHVGASHSSPAVLEVALRYMVERAADTEEGQTERIEGSATGRDGCFSFYASGRSFLSGGAPVYRATLLVHRERCTDSQSGGQE